MTVFDILTLICGLAMFLYGMQIMGNSLKKSAGSGLNKFLGKMTSNPIKGFLLGLVVTAIMQSSSATTVMVVGFVNSGTMTLTQSVSVIIGANVGAVATYWLTALSALGSTGASTVTGALEWLKPSSWMPIIAIVGVAILMFSKRSKRRDFASVLLGFSVLMVGMDLMSGAVASLGDDSAFREVIAVINNPVVGITVGTIITAAVQSSAASVGILQTLTQTGTITYGIAIPIIMGQNIGTCITAMLSSIGANKNGRRAALVHLYFNLFGSAILLALYCLIGRIIGGYPFEDMAIGPWAIAAVHSVLKVFYVVLGAAGARLLERAAFISVRESGDDSQTQNLLDERLFKTPSVAVDRAISVTQSMAMLANEAFVKALSVLGSYDGKLADEIRGLEDKGDIYEDTLGTYLVKLSNQNLDDEDHGKISMLLHIIGDLERISDHAVNVVESAEEINDKKVEFSAEAKKELSVLYDAVSEILNKAVSSFIEGDIRLAHDVEPLEEVIDDLCDEIKSRHIVRLQKSECTIEHGFVLADLLTNCERVSDHCSNIAGCLIEVSEYESLDMHSYLGKVKAGGEDFNEKSRVYREKYKIS